MAKDKFQPRRKPRPSVADRNSPPVSDNASSESSANDNAEPPKRVGMPGMPRISIAKYTVDPGDVAKAFGLK